MKIIKVKNCKDCPKSLLQRCTLKVTGLLEEEYTYIPNREYETIPSWCPLENYGWKNSIYEKLKEEEHYKGDDKVVDNHRRSAVE